LNLSCVAISKIIKKQKENLFSRLQKKGIFWSYATTAMLHDLGDAVFIEHTLKYGDFDDIVELFTLYGKKVIFKEPLANLSPKFPHISIDFGI